MSSTTMGIYARFQALAALKSLQPAFRMARSLVASGMNYQPGHFTNSGEFDVLERIRASGTTVDTIFDVGANVGGWAAAAAEIFPYATIYSFEPASATFRQLDAQAAGCHIVPVRAALSNTPGTRTLYSVPGMYWMSSLEEFAVLQGATGMLEGGPVDYVQFEMGIGNLDMRTFLRDFVNLLEPDYPVFRILRNGLDRLNYSVKEESFSEANFFAVANGRPVP